MPEPSKPHQKTSQSPEQTGPSQLLYMEGASATPLVRTDLLPAHLLDGDEIVIFATKPSLWYILFTSVRWLIAMSLIIGITYWLRIPDDFSKPLLIKTALALAGARVGFALLQWVSRLYVLTNRRVIRLRGIFNVELFECQLHKIQNTYLTMSWYERPAGLGSISFATAGTGGIEATWQNLNNPMEIHERIRSAIHRAQKHGDAI